MYDFGLRLKKLRKSRGLTQKMLADRINKSVSAVSSYESNAQLPPLDVSKSIALALGISNDYLVGNEETPAYTAKNLTEYQAELLDELISEFHSPTNRLLRLAFSFCWLRLAMISLLRPIRLVLKWKNGRSGTVKISTGRM